MKIYGIFVLVTLVFTMLAAPNAKVQRYILPSLGSFDGNQGAMLFAGLIAVKGTVFALTLHAAAPA